MNRQFRIVSYLLALGAFFLPFLAPQPIRARSETLPPNPAPERRPAIQNDRQPSENQLRRKHAAFCESVREDVALGVF
jgi:hypothetical protein